MFTTVWHPPLLFITVCKRLGTEETSCSSLGIGMLSNSCLIQASSCSTVLGLLCRIFLVMMRQMFSMGERSELQAGHFSTRILLLRSHDQSQSQLYCQFCHMYRTYIQRIEIALLSYSLVHTDNTKYKQ